MLFTLIKKLGIFLLSLLLVMTITFFLLKAIPGDPFIREQVIPKEIIQALHSYYGLDQPLWIQYLTYIKGFVTGSLPPSMIYEGKHLADFIRQGFPLSALLGLEGLCLALFFGIFLGSIGAFYQGKWQGTLAMIAGMLGLSIPSFLMATLFQYIFAIKLSLVPIARGENFSHTLLPAIAIAALPSAFITRLTRSTMIEVLQQGYIKMAYVKGLSSLRIYFHHVLRNSISPILAYIGPLSAHILTGSFVVEKIFALPGLGQWFISSILHRDYPIIMGLTVFYSTLLLFSVFLVDLLFPMINPKMETAKTR